jgi:adenosylcobinamide-GDP ribazoletransferase
MLLEAIFPAEVRSALVLGLWVLLTGALHFDGLLDSLDGLFGGDTRERCLQIMRDERTGAYATAGGALVLLTMFSALNAASSTRSEALLLAPVLGRLGITLAVVTFPYARGAGLGRDIKDHARPWHAIAAALTTAAVVGAMLWQRHELTPLLAAVVAALIWWLASRLVLHKIGGMTGDTYGAINMLIEASVLLVFAAAV